MGISRGPSHSQSFSPHLSDLDLGWLNRNFESRAATPLSLFKKEGDAPKPKEGKGERCTFGQVFGTARFRGVSRGFLCRSVFRESEEGGDENGVRGGTGDQLPHRRVLDRANPEGQRARQAGTFLFFFLFFSLPFVCFLLRSCLLRRLMVNVGLTVVFFFRTSDAFSFFRLLKLRVSGFLCLFFFYLARLVDHRET